MLALIVPLIIAFVTAIVLTPLVRKLAPRFDLIDRPDPQRKLHGRLMPLGGGVAVLIAATVGVLVASLMAGEVGDDLRISGRQWLTFLGAAGLICALGLADDRRVLRGRQKLAGQVVAVVLLIRSGLLIQNIEFLDCRVELGLLAVPFTLCWMLGAINSLNLLDGADGFATTIGIIISMAVAVMAAMTGHPAEAAIALAVTGALLAFLIFNFPPASIFLGDAGSMLIGLAVGVLAIRSSLKGPATVALAAPLAVLAIPFFDSTVAILRRWLTGRSIYTTDRGHLHHNLSRHGLGPRAILLTVAMLCAATATGALVGVFMKNEICALVSVVAALGILVVSRIFGFSELVLLTTRAFAFGNSLLRTNSQRVGLIHQESVRLQGSRNWDVLWDSLTEFAEKHDLYKVRLDLNVAWLHEGYHAQWNRSRDGDELEPWSLRFPLLANGRTLGRVEIVGPNAEISVSEALIRVAELLELLEPNVLGLADELPRDADADDSTCADDSRVCDIRPEDSVVGDSPADDSRVGGSFAKDESGTAAKPDYELATQAAGPGV